MAKNVGWLAGSRGFTGLVSVVYLGLAARALGPRAFGSFTLVLTYAQLIANLVQFQSWKGVIRFGAVHAATNDRDRLARLFGFTATLDWASALVGLTLAITAVPLVAPLLHWNAGEQRAAALFGGFLLLTTGATASGVLRLFDRFDLIAYTDAAAPMVRLVGSIAAWIAGGGVGTFLIIWAAASAAQLVALWIAVLFVHGSRLAVGRHAFVTALRENRRILRFMVQTNLANSLGLFWLQLGTLAVGAVAGPAEAGGFRIAQRLAKAIAKPIEPITRALYPELARLVAQGEHSTLRHVLLRVSAIAAALASLVVVATGFGGGEILRLVAGKQFEFAHQFLFLLSIAAAIDLAGFALEPFHTAHGRAGRVLRSNAVGALIYLLLLALLLRGSRGEGAAIAAIGAALAIFAQLAVSAMQILGKTNRPAARAGRRDEEEARTADTTTAQTDIR
jgi:O-antigen/teichoic acid export membrane protein